MTKAIIGKKIGMTQIFDEAGKVVPVTVIEAGPCVVVQKKTTENDGYEAVQLGFGDVSPKHVNKPEAGHFKKNDVAFKKTLKEFRLDDISAMNVGDILKADVFAVGDRIDVVAEEAQEMILRANHQTDPKRAAQIIYDFVLRIDTLSLKLRMAVALGLMSDDAKAQCDMLIAKIKDEARGWRNYFLRGEGVVGKSNGPSAESL